MVLYITLTQKGEQYDHLTQNLLEKFSYKVENGGPFFNYEECQLIAEIRKYAYHVAHNRKDENGELLHENVWSIESIYTEKGEGGQRIWELEKWNIDFTEYCNILIQRGMISEWEWHNCPTLTWGNQQGPKMRVSHLTWQKGIEIYYHEAEGCYEPIKRQ